MVFYNSMHKNSFFNNHKIRFKNNNLRFSGFTDEWNEVKLGDISKSITKGTTPKKYSDTGINFVKVESIENNKIYKIDAFIDENTHKNELSRSILKTNDLLFSIAGSLGRTTIVTENILPANTNQALSIIRFYDNCNCNLNFIQSRLNTYDIAKYIFQNLAVGAQPNLNLQQVGNIKIRIPSFNEQNKIQGFLECVDIKIELLKKKYQQYQEFKKYLMQQIFTQKLRFDFKDTWDKVLLKDVAFIPKKTKLTNIEGLKLLTVKLHTKGIEINDRIKPKLTKRGRPYYIRRSGELLIGRQNFHNGGMGIVPKSLDEGICSNAISSFNVFEDKIDVNYLYYFLARPEYYIKSERLIGGTGQKEFSEKELLKLKIDLPSLEEQNKIVDFLSNIDHKIELSENQLNKTQEFKKGLLQQMFVVQLILSLLQNKKHI